MTDSKIAPPTAEEVQRIAEICGEFSLGGCGIIQYRATFPAWLDECGEELKPPQVVAVQPEKVEGIYPAIWLRLRQQPEYKPLEAMRNKMERGWQAAARWRAKAEAATKYIAALERELSPDDGYPPSPEVKREISARKKADWENLP